MYRIVELPSCVVEVLLLPGPGKQPAAFYRMLAGEGLTWGEARRIGAALVEELEASHYEDEDDAIDDPFQPL